jgi:hypothetical protein
MWAAICDFHTSVRAEIIQQDSRHEDTHSVVEVVRNVLAEARLSGFGEIRTPFTRIGSAEQILSTVAVDEMSPKPLLQMCIL